MERHCIWNNDGIDYIILDFVFCPPAGLISGKVVAVLLNTRTNKLITCGIYEIEVV